MIQQYTVWIVYPFKIKYLKYQNFKKLGALNNVQYF